ncbi:patr class I histocompatibility antigen, B-2 alpha chain-like isoform X2 [Erythrolamprus reginae]|uniref:patr class I histocompatibility antigen, B-2 alpha chain-like isoform X2 n=1 Tax=Erythrolamprus reginae TaxID=121349 RepID=UPI00396C6F37
MALRSAPLLLLVLVAVALRESCFGASSHSLKYFFTSISEPSQGLLHFVSVGYVDDQLFSYYDSNSRKLQPRVSWVEKVEKEDPQYWDRNTQRARSIQETFRRNLETLRSRYNQSEEPPVVTMSSRTEVEDGMETHVCRVHGFYPREIDASWTRDGEIWLQDTFHGFLTPNADRTFHYWISLQIDRKERGRYRCHVEHDGLQDPLDLELKEPTDSKSNLGLIIGCIAVLVLVCVIAGIAVLFKRRQNGYRAASRSNQAIEQPPPSPSGESQHEERGEERGSTFF